MLVPYLHLSMEVGIDNAEDFLVNKGRSHKWRTYQVGLARGFLYAAQLGSILGEVSLG